MFSRANLFKSFLSLRRSIVKETLVTLLRTITGPKEDQRDCIALAKHADYLELVGASYSHLPPIPKVKVFLEAVKASRTYLLTRCMIAKYPSTMIWTKSRTELNLMSHLTMLPILANMHLASLVKKGVVLFGLSHHPMPVLWLETIAGHSWSGLDCHAVPVLYRWWAEALLARIKFAAMRDIKPSRSLF